MRILALDPGVTVGWATGTLHLPSKGVEGVADLEYGTTPMKEFMIHYSSRLREEEPPYDVIVYESWLLRRKEALSLVGSDLPSSQVIGVIRNEVWMANRRPIRPIGLHRQHPQDKRSIDAHMGGTAYLPKSDVDHARDAIRHLYYYAWSLQAKGE